MGFDHKNIGKYKSLVSERLAESHLSLGVQEKMAHRCPTMMPCAVTIFAVGLIAS